MKVKPNKKTEQQAEQLSRDPVAADKLAQNAARRAEKNRGRLGQAFDDVATLTRLVRAWASGRYRVVPVSTILAILVALVYFMNPLDLIPDFIVALGFLDDLSLIAAVVNRLQKDLSTFREWEQQQTRQDATT